MQQNLNENKLLVAILISGRGSNMQALIKATENPDFPAKIVLVLSNKKEASGLDFVKSKGIKTAIVSHQDFNNYQQPRLAFEEAMQIHLVASGAQLVCLAGFMRILSPWFVEKWRNRLINIHPSLLPDFKGANAVQDAIDAKVRISGCSTHFVSEEMDAGEIIMQKAVNILENDDKESLAQRILQAEHEIYPLTLQKICEKILIKN